MALTKGAIFLAITVGPLMAHGAEITIPLTVGFELIGQQLAEQVYTEDGNAPLWRESDCRYLSLDSPAFSHQDGRLRFTTHGAGSFGAEVLETCVGPFGWKAPANQGELGHRFREQSKNRVLLCDSIIARKQFIEVPQFKTALQEPFFIPRERG
ncbi:MAG: hypothetical protein ACREX9_11870 [Gammaproteobacteria bacterium]